MDTPGSVRKALKDRESSSDMAARGKTHNVGCRFITSRTAMDFEIANYMLANENLHNEQPVLNVSHFLSA